jgi:hypothetical protein
MKRLATKGYMFSVVEVHLGNSTFTLFSPSTALHMAFEGQYLSDDDKMDDSKMLGDQDLDCDLEALNESAMMFDGAVLYLH